MSSQGAKSNSTGNLLESTVKSVFLAKGFALVNYRDYERGDLFHGGELLVENVPFTSVYDHRGSTEFLLKSAAKNVTIRIECKWQQVAGSVDEKLPYLYLNCIEAMPEDRVLILIDGPGWKPGSIQWLRNAAKDKKYTTDANRHKLVEVLTLSEFLVWANNSL